MAIVLQTSCERAAALLRAQPPAQAGAPGQLNRSGSSGTPKSVLPGLQAAVKAQVLMVTTTTMAAATTTTIITITITTNITHTTSMTIITTDTVTDTVTDTATDTATDIITTTITTTTGTAIITFTAQMLPLLTILSCAHCLTLGCSPLLSTWSRALPTQSRLSHRLRQRCCCHRWLPRAGWRSHHQRRHQLQLLPRC